MTAYNQLLKCFKSIRSVSWQHVSPWFAQVRLIIIAALLFSHQPTLAAYKGSHAYNHTKAFSVQVNTATGTLSLSYPLIQAPGVRMPLTVNLTYSFNAVGMFGLPTGWQLDLDYVSQHTAQLGGMQWLIDNLWHDENGFASGLKYYNQHGIQFIDQGQSLPVPGYPPLNYRHISQHKDGSRQFFSHQGLLILQVDRFGNHVQFRYEEPVDSLQSARLTSIEDDYGNIYRFSYEPGTLIVHSPDHREQRVYFSGQGVTSIENPLKQRYKITYINSFDRSLVRTLQTPEGLITELSYGSIFYLDDGVKKQMPVVNRFKQFDLTTLKTHHEAYYRFSEDNNFTGYPTYTLSDLGDSLMDSNDQFYKYRVEVTYVNGQQQRQQVYEYNYLHLPVEMLTLRQGQPYLKTTYEYAISPFKYSRSTNYDKPTEVTRHIWNKSAYVPINKTATTYDRYGNKLRETRSAYNRERQQWQPLEATVSRYFTEHYSLLAEHTRFDLLCGRAIRKRYELAADGKTHSHVRLAWKPPLADWQDWQQTDLTHDDKGRQRTTTLRWLIKNQPGMQSVSHHTDYQFDPATAELTISQVSDQGRKRVMVMDTRNARHLKTITPKGETTTYTYDALNRPLTQTNPAGYMTRSTYETLFSDGRNTTAVQSPLGDTRRTIYDASRRPIRQQDLHKGQWRTLSSQSYNAFGKVDSKTNILGLTSTFAYDEQSRRTQTTDPWGNEHHVDYQDAAMTTTTHLNGRLHQVIHNKPWERKRITRYYPVTNNPHDLAIEFLENTVVQDAYNQTISTTSALVELNTEKKRQTTTNHLRYDAQHNLIASDTHTWDGLHGHKTRQYDLRNHLYTWHKTLKTPEHTSSHSGYRYLYDSDGLLTQVESPPTADGSRLYLQHRYDSNGRKIEKTLPNGQRIHYQYDQRGLLTQHVWKRNQKPYTVNHQYDGDGRLIKLSDSDGQTMHYRYSKNGRLLQLRFPDNRSIRYTLDDYDRTITQQDANQIEQHFVYKPEDKGRLSSLKVKGTQINFHYGEDDNGQRGQLLKRTTNAKTTGVTETRFRYGVYGHRVESATTNPKAHYTVSYNYTPRGELIKQVQKLTQTCQPPQQQTTEYRYDGIHRLISEVNSDQTAIFQKRYHYDGNNNLLAEAKHSNCGPGQIHQYAYNPLDQLLSVRVGEVVKLVLHDTNGQLTQDHQATQYQYDDAGFLLQVQPPKQAATRYEYWPNGLLRRSSRGDTHSHFYPDHHKNVQTVVKNRQWRSLVRHGSSIVGRQTDQGLDQFFRVNESTGALLQPAKGETQLHRYDAYGKPLQSQLTDDTDFTWNQELNDPNTQLTYLRHRFYSPPLRRFIARDNQAVDNRYAYALANPVNNIDPSGNNAVGNYISGGLLAGFGLLGIALAVPTAGASVGWSAATIAGSVSSFLSGTALIGSQTALNAGNKAAAKALSISSMAFGAVGAVDLAASLSSLVTNGLAGSAARAVLTGSETGAGFTGITEPTESLDISFNREETETTSGVTDLTTINPDKQSLIKDLPRFKNVIVDNVSVKSLIQKKYGEDVPKDFYWTDIGIENRFLLSDHVHQGIIASLTHDFMHRNLNASFTGIGGLPEVEIENDTLEIRSSWDIRWMKLDDSQNPTKIVYSEPFQSSFKAEYQPEKQIISWSFNHPAITYN